MQRAVTGTPSPGIRGLPRHRMPGMFRSSPSEHAAGQHILTFHVAIATAVTAANHPLIFYM
jgi:hypothetical protein